MSFAARVVVAIGFSVSLTGFQATADPAAINYDFVRAEEIVEAASVLGEDEAKSLTEAIDRVRLDQEAPHYQIEGFQFAGSRGQLEEALLSVIASALRAGYPEDVDEFIKHINEDGLIRGFLSAREGGPHKVLVSLLSGDGQRTLVLSRQFENGKSITFSRRVSICQRDPRSAYTPEGSHMRERTSHVDRTLICDETRGEWIMDGPWTEWDKSGSKLVEGQYTQNERTGLWLFRDKQGRKSHQSQFKDGKEIETTDFLWHDDATLWREETQRRDTTGDHREIVEYDYFQDGKKRSVKRYRDGYRNGEWTLWDESGQVTDRTTYHKGVAFPPEPSGNPLQQQVYALFAAAAGADKFDTATLAPLAQGLTKGGEEILAALIFSVLKRSDDNHPEIFERLYRTVIEFAPDSELAHNAYWRLANLYRQAYDTPRLEAIVELMEHFLARYQTSNVVSMEKYPDAMLVFSPLRTLHQAYEELGRFEPIASYYQKQLKAGKTLMAEDSFDYAHALDRLGQLTEAARWYRRYLEIHTERDYSRGHVLERLKALAQ